MNSMRDIEKLNRGELRVAPRSIMRPVDSSPRAKSSREINKQYGIISDNSSDSSSSLPTIPIMAYVDGEPTNITKIVGPLSNDHKYLDPIMAKKPISIVPVDTAIQKTNPIESAVAKIDYKPDPVVGDLFEKEPATQPVSENYKKTKKKTNAKAAKPKKEKHKTPILRQVPVTIMVFAILGATGYVSFSTWQTNNQVKSALRDSSHLPSVLGTETTKKLKDEEQNNDANVIFSDYSVAADLPRVIYIDKINVVTKILPMNLDADGTLQSPGDASDAGWYTGSAKPGKDGVVLVDGHTSAVSDIKAIFDRLGELVIDDKIMIESGDGKKFTYQVVHTETVPLDDVDMPKALKPYGDAKQGLNLITCTGSWITQRQTLDHRLIVYAALKE